MLLTCSSEYINFAHIICSCTAHFIDNINILTNIYLYTLYTNHSRYKRTKILEAYKSPDPKCKDIDYIKSLITCPPGLESYIPSPSSSPETSLSLQDELSKLSSTQRTDISRTNIQSALKDNLTPNDTRDRMHRKTHGCMSFVEMSKIMSSSWKAIDDINKAVFEELAVQGRIIHAAKLVEYEKYNPPASKKSSPSSSPQSQSQEQLSLEISAMIERSQQEPPPPGSVLVWSHPSSQSLSSGGDMSMGSGKKSVSKKARGLEAGKSGSSMSSSSGGRSSSSSKKKKRDKPSMESQIVKPKRPLSAYNLFYRYKRVKILKAYTSKVSCWYALSVSRRCVFQLFTKRIESLTLLSLHIKLLGYYQGRYCQAYHICTRPRRLSKYEV